MGHQAPIFALLSLNCEPLAEAGAAQSVRKWFDDCEIRLSVVGCWKAEIGNLFEVCLLLAIRETEAFQDLKQQIAMEPAPFLGNGRILDYAIEELVLFPFLNPGIVTNEGAVFEFRTYHLHPDGLVPTLNGWRDAVPQAGDYTRHLRGAFHMPTGAPRIFHIWGFDSFEQRSALRQSHYISGLWPPKGGPASISSARSSLYLPIR